MKTIVKVLIMFSALFVFSAVFMVLEPVVRERHDNVERSKRFDDMLALTGAIHDFKENQSHGLYPQALEDIVLYLQPYGPETAGDIMTNRFDDYVYLAPSQIDSGERDVAILAEKLGHYRRERGAYVGFTSLDIRWISEKDYTNVLQHSLREGGTAETNDETRRMP